MALPVPTTKLHTPYAHPEKVQRSQLIQELDEGSWHGEGVHFARCLTTVPAPEGADAAYYGAPLLSDKVIG
jgi:hypothetical protein